MLHLLYSRLLDKCHWDRNGKLVKGHKISTFRNAASGEIEAQFCMACIRRYDIEPNATGGQVKIKGPTIVCKYCNTEQPLDKNNWMWEHSVNGLKCRTQYQELFGGKVKQWTHFRRKRIPHKGAKLEMVRTPHTEPSTAKTV